MNPLLRNMIYLMKYQQNNVSVDNNYFEGQINDDFLF